MFKRILKKVLAINLILNLVFSNFAGLISNVVIATAAEGKFTADELPYNIKFTQVATGYGTTLALDSYNLWAWGDNTYGAFGNGKKVDSLTPIKAKSFTNYAYISTSGATSAAIDKSGIVKTWGWNYCGQLGNGNTNDQLNPVGVAVSMPKVTKVIAGINTMIALDINGNIWGWGKNQSGVLLNEGKGNMSDTSYYYQDRPLQLTSDRVYKDVDFNGNNVAAIDSDGNLWMWGANSHSQLAASADTYKFNNGFVNIEGSYTPIQIKNGTKFSMVSLGNDFVLALDTSGNLWGWGRADKNQLGKDFTGQTVYDRDNNCVITPTNLGSGYTFIDAGEEKSIAIHSNGGVYKWGIDEDINCFLQNMYPSIDTYIDYTSVQISDDTITIFDTNGDLWMLGNNSDGQIGNGTKTDATEFIQITGDTKYYTVTFKNGTTTVDTQTIEAGSSATAPTLTKEGYTLSWDKSFSNVTSDLTVNAVWTAKTGTAYKVEHYKQNVAQNGYVLAETENLTGTTDANVTATAKTYEGFSENTTYSGRVASGTVKGDGSLVLKLYYDINKYTVTFKSDGVTQKTETVTYGGSATAPTLTKEGYTLSWDKNFNNITSDLTVNAVWTQKPDTLKPVIIDVTQTLASTKKSSTLTINAQDNATDENRASGVVGYAITTNNTVPTSFQSSNSFEVTKNGKYYAWAKDGVGNISDYVEVLVKDIEIDVTGNITWNDDSNKYSSRAATTLKLYRKIGVSGTEQLVTTIDISAGQTSYIIQTRETNDNGEYYIFRIVQDNVAGYETTYTGNNIQSSNTQNLAVNVTNNLIVPTYTSSITYTPVDTYNNQYLKNGKVKINAVVQNTNDTTYQELGLNNGVVTLTMDSAIQLDTSTLKIYYTNAEGTKKSVTSYTLNGNVLTIDFGDSKVSKVKDKIEVEIIGTTTQIKEYTSTINLTGNLRAYNGINTSINLGELTKAENKFTVQYQMPKANIQLTKKDSITEEVLTDATFTLYEWNGSEYVQKEILTDGNKDGIYVSNYYEWNALSQGKYRILETGVPLNHKDLSFSMEYVVDQLKVEDYTITPEYNNGAYRIAYATRNPDDFDKTNGIVENEPFKLKVGINNVDSETKEKIQSNAIYTIYEWDKENNQYVEYVSKTAGNKVEMTKGTDGIYLPSQWLYYTTNNEGKFKVVETTAPNGYYGDFDSNGQKRQYEFNVIEIIDDGIYEGQNIENEGTILLKNNTTSNTIENKRVETLVNISIIDDETKTNKSQASATLEGAKYGIYAREQINHADGVTSRYPGEAGVLYKQDELVKEVTTDENGKITIEDLKCGKYYVKQHVPSDGYVKDEIEHELDLSYQGEKVALIEENEIYENAVKKQAIQILKQQYTSLRETQPLANAGFTIYEIKELSIVKDNKITKNTDGTYTLNDTTAKKDSRITKKVNENGTYNIEDLVDYYYKIQYTEENMSVLPQGQNAYYPYDMEDEPLVKNYENNANGQEILQMISGTDGYIKSPELAYGEYILVETSVPHNKVAVTPILIKITSDSREAQSLKYVIDPDFETKIKIYTVDADTNEVILKENAGFVIKNTETEELVTYQEETGTYENPYETTRRGYALTPVSLGAGNYELIQVQAQDGYVLNGYEGYSNNGEIIENPQEKVTFEISTNKMYFVDNELESNIIVTVQENKAQVGTLKVSVEGEKLSNVDKAQTPYTFAYEKEELQGVELGLYAKEDIYTQDNQSTKIYDKDQLVQSKSTDSNGIINYDNIPIGNYYVKEINEVQGFVQNEEVKDVDITYGTNEIQILQRSIKTAQETPVTKYEFTKESQRQKVNITVTNNDSVTNEPIQGSTIGLYAKEDIVNKDGQIVVNKNELIEKQTTNSDGTITMTSDLPIGSYYLKELETATGYASNTNIVDIDATYEEDGREVINIQEEMQNTKTSIYVKPVDENGNIVEGSILQLVNEEGNLLQEWTSTKDVTILQKLEVGEKYILKQKQPLNGYATIDEVEIVVNSDGNLENQVSDETNTIKPVHYTTKLQMYLQDKETKQKIQGVNFEILQNDTVILEFATEENGRRIEKLPIGQYVLRQKDGQQEVLQNLGYSSFENVSFEIKDTGDVQELIVEQDYTKLEVEVVDKEIKSKVEDIEFEIYYKKADGTLEKIKEFTTSEQNYTTTKLAVGNYILRQVAEQKENLQDKGYTILEDIEFTIQDSNKTQKLIVEQDYTKLEVEVVDIETNSKVEGVKFAIYHKKDDGNEDLVREFTTSANNYTTTKLPVGNYILRQALNLQGYAVLEDVEFSIQDSNKNQKMIVKLDYTKLEIEVVDKLTKEKIQGVKFEIYSKDENGSINKVQEFTTSENNYVVTKLSPGQYILKQVANQKEVIQDKGYATLEDIEFEVRDTTELQKVMLEQDYTKVKVYLQDQETKEKIEGIKLQIVQDEKIIHEFTTKEEGYLVQKLPVGEYILRQSLGQNLENNGYASVKDTPFEVKDTTEVQDILANRTYTKVEINLQDKQTKEQLEGIKLQIVQNETLIHEFTTKEEGYLVQKLPVGKYTLRQVSDQEAKLQNKGYATLDNVEFEVKDTTELQKVILEQDYTKLEIEVQDINTQEKVEGTTIEVVDKKTGKVIKEFTTTSSENYKIEKLPIGEYLLRFKGINENKGYLKGEDTAINIIDTAKIQKAVIKQDYTKVSIQLLDKDTKEPVVGATLRITDKDGKEIVKNWITDEKDKLIEKLPVGEYYLEQIAAPTLKGYVKTEKILFKVEESSDVKEVIMLQDYTKLKIEVTDEVTNEKITDVTLDIKDEKGNVIATVTTKEDSKDILERLPVGKYTIESTKVPYGYKTIKTTIEVKDQQGIQGDIKVGVQREEFDLSVKAWVQEINRNNQVEYTNKNKEQNIKKVDIKDKKINTEQIRLTYKIEVSNLSKITGKVGKIEVSIPAGMKFISSDNKTYWKQENGKVVTTGLATQDLKQGSSANIELVLRWENGLENFGTKQIQVSILETTSDIGFEETNKENNKVSSQQVIIGVSTGEMNLVYACWILLIILIIAEIIISRKTKIKKFGLKDRTLKYKK